MKLQIQPVEVFPDTATHLVIIAANIRQFVPGSAFISWQLLNASGDVLKTGGTFIEGAEYEGWNDDFPYLSNILLQKLGLVEVT